MPTPRIWPKSRMSQLNQTGPPEDNSKARVFSLDSLDDLQEVKLAKMAKEGDIAIFVQSGSTTFWVFRSGEWIQSGDAGPVLFGADPLGVKDSSDAFETMLELGVEGKVPSGTYRLTRPLLMRSRTSLVGATPENGSNIAGHRTTFILEHTGDGISLADNPSSGVSIRNIYIQRHSSFPSSNALIRLANSTGAEVKGVWGLVIGTGQGLVLGPSTFFSRVSLFKFYGDGAGAIGVQLSYPSTVNQLSDAMVSFSAGHGVWSDTPDNVLTNVNMEFCASGFTVGINGAEIFGPYGTLFNGCHFENNSVAGVNLTAIAIPIDLTFVGCQFSINAEDVLVTPVTGLRARQNLKFLGGVIGSPPGNVNATISARFGGLQISTEPYSGGVKIHDDVIVADAASYTYRGFFSNTITTGDRYMEAFRYDGSTHISFLLINSLSSFIYAPSAADPTITLTDPQNRDDWAPLDPLGGIVFRTSDQSGNGPGPVAAVKAINIGGTVAPFGALGFFVAGANRVIDASALKAVLTLDGCFSLGTTTLEESAILQLNSVTQGFLPPRMTKAQRNAISGPEDGLLIYQTDNTPGWRGYQGGGWHAINTTPDP